MLQVPRVVSVPLVVTDLLPVTDELLLTHVCWGLYSQDSLQQATNEIKKRGFPP